MSILVRPMQTIKWFEPNQVNTEIHAAEISDLAGILSAGRQEIDFPSEKKTFFYLIWFSNSPLHFFIPPRIWYNDIQWYRYSTSVWRLFTNELFRNRHIFRSHLQLKIDQCYLAYKSKLFMF